jgi:RNA polymerase sigma-70 factor (ECF subfamily)
MQEKVMNAVDSLPEHYRIPFVMSRFENRKNKEIAETLNIPIRTVETRIYRALNLLKEKLENQVFTFFSIFRSH